MPSLVALDSYWVSLGVGSIHMLRAACSSIATSSATERRMVSTILSVNIADASFGSPNRLKKDSRLEGISGSRGTVLVPKTWLKLAPFP
jgi:hypothetical protein